MFITTFQCDRCNKTWDHGKANYVSVGLVINWHGGRCDPKESSFATKVLEQQWCRDCVDAYVQKPLQQAAPECKEATETELLVDLLERLGFKRE